jgi:hypothetical protein
MEIGGEIGGRGDRVGLSYQRRQGEVHLAVQVGQCGPQAERARGAHNDVGVDDARVVQEQIAAAFEHQGRLRLLYANSNVKMSVIFQLQEVTSPDPSPRLSNKRTAC